MDLAIALGRDVRSMPERDFWRWSMFFRRKSTPLRRIEVLLAQLCVLLAQSVGVEAPSIDDYLFEPARDENGCLIDTPETDSDDLNYMESELMR